MATKERTYMMDELGDPDAPIGSRLWCLYVSNEIRKTYYDKTYLGARLKDLVRAFTEHQGWQELGFFTWEVYCEKRLQVTAEELDAEARSRVAAMAENAKALSKHGGTRKSAGDQDYNYNLDKGTNPEYLTARIARDRPDILADMKAGKYRSVRAAAIVAGIIDADKTPYQVPKDPAKAGRYLAKHVDAEWMMICYEEFMKGK